jgi:hypothetical protein
VPVPNRNEHETSANGAVSSRSVRAGGGPARPAPDPGDYPAMAVKRAPTPDQSITFHHASM